MAARPRRISRNERPLRQAILIATEELLVDRPFDELRVEDILEAADVSRSTFYLYFESRHAVLAELARSAFGEAVEGEWPWAEQDPDTPLRETLEHAVRTSARLRRDRSAVLRAIVENWRSDPVLTELWHGMMEGLIARVAERIEEARANGLARPSRADAGELAALLVWMGERAHYLAAIEDPRFADEERLIDALVDVWHSVIFDGAPAVEKPRASSRKRK
jgi:TetR/AcrR family transcriptional regulator, ethionamide resistance regulator